MIRRTLLLLLVTLGLSGYLPRLAHAQSTPTADQVNEIAKHLFCPTCQNVPLDQCATTVCEQWRATIADLLQQGYTTAQVEQYFAERYGNQVLADPPRKGWGAVLWVAPLVALTIGMALYIRYFRRSKPQPKPAANTTDPYIEQLEAELARLKQERHS